MNWDLVHITEAVAAGLHRAAEADDAEQAVYSLDALDELGLHPLINGSLEEAGYGTFPEQRYPSDRGERSGRRTKKSEGQRCDLVLTPDNRPLTDPDAEATLFAPTDAVSLETAFWLEIKTVSQFTTEGPSPHYSKELLSPVTKDLRKLAADRLIFHAGLLLVLFTEDEATAAHDLDAWERRALQKGYPVAPPIARHMPITDRLGNGHMVVALFAVRRL